MSKAILILDNMPKNCIGCPVRQYAMEYEDVAYVYCGKVDEVICDGITSRPNWCPLKPLPKKDNCKIPYISNRIKLSDGEEVAYYMGFNDCIDEILGE